MTTEAYHNSPAAATRSEAPQPIPVGPPHVVGYALNCGPGLNIPTWAVYMALAHFADDRGAAERTHREIADAIDGGSVSTVKAAIQHLEFFGKVEVTRRPGATGGKNLPNIYRITGEEFNWEPAPKGPREPGQIFAAYRRRHEEIEAAHLRSYEDLEQGHRRREQDLLRRIEELEAAINGHAPRPEEETTPPSTEASGSRETAIRPGPAPQPSSDTAGDTARDTAGLPGSFRNEPAEPGGAAGPPESHGPAPDSRETAIAPDRDPPGEEEDEVDVLTREFWPWMKGKWDDINYAIHWYKRNRGEWTRQLKNARAAREAGPEDRAEDHRRDHERRGAELERTPVWDSSIPPDPDAGSLWSTVLEDLRTQLPRHAFDTWLKPTAGVAFRGDQFIVAAPTALAAEWLERRMFHALQSALERAAGRRLQLRLQTLEAHDGEDPPAGDDGRENPSGPDYGPGGENDG